MAVPAKFRNSYMATISRNDYVRLFGRRPVIAFAWATPASSSQIERDLRGSYGDEIVFGGG
jgi:urease subunit alpha